MPPTRAARQRAAVIYHPLKVNLTDLRAKVASAEKSAGWDPSLWLETSKADPGAGLAASAIDAGVDVVLAVGGDGTVRAVAEGLQGSGVPLALLPAGTANLLARNMNLYLGRPADAVRTAFTGKNRPIDLGVVEIEREDGSRVTHSFVVMAGLGLDAQMAAKTDPEWKRRVGWLAYVDTITRSLRDPRRMRMRYSVDGGGERSLTAHTVLVGNCGSLPGNILLLPDAEIDDGVLDIVTLRPKGFIGWVQIWIKITWENGVLRRSTAGRKLMGLTREVRALRYQRASRMTARLDRPELCELDGDNFGYAVAFRTHVAKHALLVRVPARRRALAR